MTLVAVTGMNAADTQAQLRSDASQQQPVSVQKKASRRASSAERPMTFADSTQAFYGRQDATSLRGLLARSDERTERWLCLYRLYPLTDDKALLDDVPASLDDGTAREYALLAGLWGYRAAARSFPGNVSAGRHSMNLLEKARKRDPHDPFALLIGAQSLLFRPALFGGNAEEALRQLTTLRRHVKQAPSGGIALMEVNQWIWYALCEQDRHDEARALRDRLLAQDPPPLYRDFLQTAR
jgi:hypothetical protein